MTISEHDEESAEAANDAPGPAPEFDPLLSPWEESPHAAFFAVDDADDIAGSSWRSSSASGPAPEGDLIFWEAAPAAPYSAQPQPGLFPVSPAHAAADRLTAARTDLWRRPGSEAIPPAEARGIGAHLLFAGVGAVLAAGLVAVASGLVDAPGGSALLYGAVAAAALLLVFGFALTVTAARGWKSPVYETPYGQQVPPAEVTIPVPRPRTRWLVMVREVAETLLLALLIFLAVRASFQNFRVEGHSMDPSLADGEYLIVNKLTYAELDLGIFDFLPFFDSGDDPVHYLWGAPERGDVIVFRAPTSPDRDFIKRIIGLPGDEVQIDEATGQVSVNGNPLTETYIQGTTNCSASCTWTVPLANTAESRQTCGSNACYFVLGDNRQNSSDSRQGWLVPKENIVGKALITYWHHGEPELDFAPNHSVGIVDQASAEQ